MPSSRPTPEAHAGDDRTTDLIRWAAFSCVLVPVVLLWYGTSLAGTAGTAVGLAAVTAVCRLLLRRSERCAPRLLDEEHPPHAPHRGGRHRTGTGSHRGGRHNDRRSPVG
ncbi:hypothetical protein NFX46_34900 [Streptomyces phaeoluteigriseus]|uniref:Uncharacterized protein n=1 Tax=Streptomyces phaeoluteigriseus TaxID=114686 RepID=A0ABY4ZJN4_9ACTN|nr:hypothetical protein [Streptomyces phaeoluteigriseus]USQ88497.1 hypothetical protein NFX46_34900 [Streptomyces phaeoluteigriseus]